MIYIDNVYKHNKRIVCCNLLDEIYYEEIISQSEVLKDTINKGIHSLNSFDLLTNEIFDLLYKIVVTFNHDKELSSISLQNKAIIKYLYNSTILNKLRKRTAGSLPNTAISIKYILDEILSKLRGSEISKTLRNEQDKLLDLYNSKKNIENIRDNLLENIGNMSPNSNKNINFPFTDTIKSLLNEIINNININNKNYDNLSLFKEIIHLSKNKLDNKISNNDDNLLDSDKYEILKKATQSSIDNFKNNFSVFDNLHNDKILEELLNKVNDETKNSTNTPNENSQKENLDNNITEFKDFNESKDFNDSTDFNESKDFINSKEFNESNDFNDSKDFNNSKELSDTKDFNDIKDDTKDFNESKELSDCNKDNNSSIEELEDNNINKSDETLKSVLDYADKKIEHFNKTNYKIIQKNTMNYNSPDLNIESTDGDVDTIIIKDSNEKALNKHIMKISNFNLTENHDNLLEFFSHDSKFKKDLLHSNDINETLHSIIDILKAINFEIIISEKSIKKQLEDLKIDKIINTSIDKIIKFDEDINLLNVNKNDISNLSFDKIIKISKYFNKPDIRMFFDKVGKKKEIAKKIGLKKKKDKIIVTDKILLSDDIDNLIDDELMNFSLDIEAFENNFYDRYLNNRLLTYEKVKSKERNRGPIILCYDGSGSMEGNKIKETKVNIISFIEIARIQKRKMIIIQFASKDEPLIIKEINPYNVKLEDIFDIINDFLCGGTDFEKPLEEAMKYVKNDKYKHADILFITDGVCSISEHFKREFIFFKKIMKLKLYSIIIHGNTYSDYGDLGDISDDVMEIRSINLSNWNEKVTEKIFSI